ncbi:MAG: hypothetical protein PHV20_10310 [Bacteroidales bacterium]|nr:hypothetical protein [Bacteroidales bacterium]
MTRRFIKRIVELPDWQSHRKIVVLESDDWGSQRMPSLELYEKLKNKNVAVSNGDNKIYNTKDSLATEDDLSALFEVLNSVKDSQRQTAVMTAVSVVANPDFDKIQEDNFRNYHYEPFTETLKRQKGCENSFQLWKEGIENKLFIPQFHAREHLNVSEWLRNLQNGDAHTRLAFEHEFWGYDNASTSKTNISYQAAFDFSDPSDLLIQAESIRSGLILFEKLFGYKASYFVPTNGPFNNSLEKVAAESGICYMYSSRLQNEPVGGGKSRRVFHYLGQKNRFNQRYILRNCFFEPCMGGKDWADSCMSDIDFAFKNRKPAVITSHRVNYIGALDPQNRTNGLSQLKTLLESIVKKWPDVEFMTTDQLGDLMSK